LSSSLPSPWIKKSWISISLIF